MFSVGCSMFVCGKRNIEHPSSNPEHRTRDRSLNGYLRDVTPTCRQYSSTGQPEHFGSLPVQTYFPNGTSNLLISTQYRRGSFASRAAIVFSGVLAAT